MKNLFKRVTSFITALAMTTTLTGGVQLVSFAEEEVFTAALTDEAYFSVDDFGLSDDELLLGYFENKLYGIDGGISTFAVPNTRSLTTKETAAYDALKAAAIEIAKGDRASAEIDVVLTWTPLEAGLGENGAFDQTDIDTTFNNVIKTVDTGKVLSYLLADCPYEFYWFDKVEGMQIPVSMSTYTSTSLPITFKFQMSVGKEYADTADYTVDTTVTKSASAAATNANAIVTSNASKSELERLTAYKDAICSLVSYDDEAVNHLNDSTYGVDPWQVIHVFDNDVNTEVVCEGYAKAFQYLCDLDGGLTCYSVTGTMTGGTGAGGHMWNIVTLGGKNYLVDVTNCDEGTAGAPDQLFLKGMTEEEAAKTYSKTIGGQKITFTYYDGTVDGTSNMADLFGTDILTLSTTDYSEAPKTITSITVQAPPTKTEYYINEKFDPTGLVIRVNYSDNSHEDVTYSAENDKFSSGLSNVTLDENQTSVMVTYDGQTAEIPVTVSEDVVLFTEYDLGISGGYGWSIDNNTLRLDTGCIGYKYIFECEYPYPVQNNGTIISGTFNSTVFNYGTIEDGTFNNDAVYNHGTITGGTFNNDIVYNYGTIEDGTFNYGVINYDGATISGGTFSDNVNNQNGATISGGTFNSTVSNFGTIEDGTFNSTVTNYGTGTIEDGTFTEYVNSRGTITGGTFAEFQNAAGATIEITNGSVEIAKCTMDNGTVTVDGTTHNHDMVATYTENPYDATKHFKTTACKNCPINYVGYENESESHSVTVFTAADNVITAKCVCGKEFGTFTLESPADLAYNGEAKTATVTVAGEVGGEATPTVEYYIGDGKLDAAPTNRGTYTAKITVDDATAELEFTIGAKNISVATVTVTPHEYTGAAQSVGIVLKDGDYTLVKDTDYSITGTSSATNAGTYTVTITGINNYQGSLEKNWTIAKANPFIGNITITPNPIYDSNTIEDITLTFEDSSAIPGTFTVNNGQTLTAGQMILKWTFTPSDTLNYKTHVGGTQIIVNADTINSIAVKTNPSKTKYIATENFDPTGLVLTVTYLSGKTADVAYSDENKGEFAFAPERLSVEDENVTITYGGKTATVPVTVTNVVTITQDELNKYMPSGIGWMYDDYRGWLKLNSGFEFIVEGECNYDVRNLGTIINGTFNRHVDNLGTITDGTFDTSVYNSGTIKDGTFNTTVSNSGTITGGTFNGNVSNNSDATITGGTFNGIVSNSGTITGGTFEEVQNWAGATIEITNGSVKIDKCTADDGTVTVDTVKHEHNGNNVTYPEYDENGHTKVTVCEDCPINLVTETIKKHSTTVFTAADNVITAKCACGEEMGTFTLVEPANLKYTGTANAATVTGEINGVETPEIKYYDVNGTEAEPRNAGAYTAKITIDEATAELEFIIKKVVPEVTVTATSNGTLYTSSTTADVTLTATATNPVSDTEVAGTIAFDGAIEFKVGTNDYPVIFTPTDTNYDPVETTVSLPVVEDTLTGIAVAGTPAKTEYAEGDKFDPTGLTVTATYASNAEKVIEHELLTISPETLAKGNTSVTVSYNGKTAEVGGITVRGKLAADKFKFTAPTGLVYDKTAKAATVTAADGVTGIGAITVRYFNGNTELGSAPVNAGTYKVVIDVALGENYVAATNISDESWTFTIEKADPVINPFINYPTTVYDTTPVTQLSLKAGCSEVGGTISFDGDITLEVGTKNYPVIFQPADPNNNYNTVNGTVTIEVKKDTIESIAVKTYPQTAYTYGESFKPDGLVITATYKSGNEVDITYTADNKNEFSFTPEELTVDTTEVTVTYAGNNEITDTIEVKVNKAIPSYKAPTNLKANYGDTLADVVLPSGWSWDAPSTSVGEVGIKTFPATYSVADENYEDVETDLGVVVSPKTISIGGIVVKNKDYDGTTDATVAAVTFDGVVNADAVDYTATGTFADKNAGTGKSVTVKITVTNKNYTLDNDTITTTATINKADPAVTIPQTASAITGLPLSKATLPDGWTWDNPTTVPENGKTYGISYIPEDTANYNTLTAQVTVTVSDCTHPETRVDIKEATCTEDGLKTTICTICEEPTSTEVIPAEHKWNNDYTVDKEATCTKNGQKSIHCAKCNEIKSGSTVVIPSGHIWNDDYTIDTEATCTTDGSKSIHCKNCTEIMPDSEVTIAASHKWNECYTSDSTKHWIDCANCDETKDENNHVYGYTQNSKKYCSICRNSYGTADNGSDRNELGAGYTNPIHTAPKPTEPQIKDENGKTGWDVISDELALAQDGDTVVVDMNGTTKLPKAILNDIAGRNVDIVLDMGSGITWTINGETVTNPKAVDLRVSKNVKRIPVNVIDNVTGDNFNMEISLAHNGEFGFEAMLTISLGRKYNDCYANLYYYNPSDKAMEFIDCDLIANGNAQLIFAHASDYAIVIDEEALGDDVSSAAGVTAENETMDTETVSVVFALPLVLAAGFVIRKKLCR